MDRNQRRARAIGMRKTNPLPHLRTTPASPGTVYFIESRPHPHAPWERASSSTATWEEKPEALRRLTARRETQPSWEHRLMERITTVTEQPAAEK
ncbi:hypothetical protein GPA10_05090 [Streptomyces sp. p1417]|uniref:Uncharacterized protein n=1 Tax=Streptomyces typhae TaxID=2681492 RepID=A0A6L6WVY7_9ACTN|nr:hypothetical protein [Streptomyces typhae]MVO84161.1 hypothetical protein [Streptomyces typhae]